MEGGWQYSRRGMKWIILGLVVAAAFRPVPSPAQTANPGADDHQWWRDRALGPYRSAQTNQLPLIRVRGNKFVDPDGQPVLFRGVSIADPDKLEHQGHWNKAHFEKIRDLGATIVRIPVHPVAWRHRTPSGYLQLLDPAIG